MDNHNVPTFASRNCQMELSVSGTWVQLKDYDRVVEALLARAVTAEADAANACVTIRNMQALLKKKAGE